MTTMDDSQGSGSKSKTALTDEDKHDIALSHKYRLALPSRPTQSNFRVLALLFYVETETKSAESNNTKKKKQKLDHILPPWVKHEDPRTSRTFIVGTNDEPGYIGGSICAERAAMVQLRFVPSFRLTKIVISTDAAGEAVPCGQLCREFLAGHGRSVPMNVPIISTGSRCRRCGAQNDDLFIDSDSGSGRCIDGHSEHSLPILQTTLADLYPYPSPYTRLSAPQSVNLGKSFREKHQSQEEYLSSVRFDEQARKLLKLAILEAKQSLDDVESIHPIQFGAAMLLEDGSTVTTHQSPGLEYGCTLDAVSQLASHIEHKRSVCGRPLFIVQADQYGIAHGPFAPARAWLSERGYNDVKFLLHYFPHDPMDEDVDNGDTTTPDVHRLRFQEVKLSEIAPSPPTWDTGIDEHESSSVDRIGDRGSNKGNPTEQQAPSSSPTTTKVSELDVWSRVKKSGTARENVKDGPKPMTILTPTAGRGSQSGWISCPLCGQYSKKKYAVGRGLANHLTAIHTPWKPSKMAQKIHRREFERKQRRRHVTTSSGRNPSDQLDSEEFHPLEEWHPSATDQEKWNQAMLKILQDTERKADEMLSSSSRMFTCIEPSTGSDNQRNSATTDRQHIKKSALSYRDSLPPFLSYAANGDLQSLKDLVSISRAAGSDDSNHKLEQLLSTQDRHRSTAEHWAAGGGHLDCLMYITELRESIVGTSSASKSNRMCTDTTTNSTPQRRSLKRRDGKTPLHYAARNGHIDCIRYLLHGTAQVDPSQNLKTQKQNVERKITRFVVDERSGEGTTPLHLACYGGHLSTVQYLIEEEGADATALNDWGCSCAHWVAMTININEEEVRGLCNYLRHIDPISKRTSCGPSFVAAQGQGHTSLHKAAQRLNEHVIRWLADDDTKHGGAGLSEEEKKLIGRPDAGGHRPSDIWIAMGGDSNFGSWMITLGW